jgi:hypothetical protein
LGAADFAGLAVCGVQVGTHWAVCHGIVLVNHGRNVVVSRSCRRGGNSSGWGVLSLLFLHVHVVFVEEGLTVF